MMDFDEEPEREEAPLNKKDITGLITGKPIDFDEEDGKAAPEEGPEKYELPPGELHPLVGVMDMMITTAQEPLRKHGYPEPNLSIWEEWGKPNLSKALVQYVPMNSAAGQAVSSPAFAGIIGLGALIIAFLPVILHFVQKKREEREQEEAAQEEAETAKPAAKVTYPIVEEEPEKAPEPEREKPSFIGKIFDVKKAEEQVKRMQTADRAAPPQMVKLPGGGDEAAPQIPMAELIARNMASGGEMPI